MSSSFDEETQTLLGSPESIPTTRSYSPKIVVASLAAFALASVAYVGLSKPHAVDGQNALPPANLAINAFGAGTYARRTGDNANGDLLSFIL